MWAPIFVVVRILVLHLFSLPTGIGYPFIQRSHVVSRHQRISIHSELQGRHDVDSKFAGSLQENSFEIQRHNFDRERPSGTTESTFSDLFRHCAPYIAMHRNSAVVIHFPSRVLSEPTALRTLMDDVAILHLLGLKLILVAGVREKVLDRLSKEGLPLRLHKGMQVTDRKVLQLVKEESGVARFEIESALAKAFGGMFTQRSTTLVSGNSFYSAKPLGVRDGVDLQSTGEVRKVEAENIRKRLDAGDVVLLTSVAHCASGEIFYVPSEGLAAQCAIDIKASKVVFYTDDSLVDRNLQKSVQSLQISHAKQLLNDWGIREGDYIRSEYAHGPESVVASSSFANLLAKCVAALNGGVTRAHLIPPSAGSLLEELFTRDGSGVLISRDVYEGIRAARYSDIAAIQEILEPLEVEGVLVPRSREVLEKELKYCHVLARDGSVLACAMLIPYEESQAEIACLAVHPSFRCEGRGEVLLAYLERLALSMGTRSLFVLSTRTMLWFEERGFVPADPSCLPPSRAYNQRRASKVYTKRLGTERDVYADELLWNVFR